ncbi:uncharacterized protein CLUP02_00682 [Colletotrichum lupini]|uniref:Uncharacterized protein n=1 Tax=Colletotrichum lupini TaxID=145971 RepID=A0A9Q8SBL3_9PEZI|nr:uncharacterized protein CLUP02_00682 [Colletotrichum lupini]UQC74035.1 hypothetical protein CLUP02_00682 [Colletotrichum lupini]
MASNPPNTNRVGPINIERLSIYQMIFRNRGPAIHSLHPPMTPPLKLSAAIFWGTVVLAYCSIILPFTIPFRSRTSSMLLLSSSNNKRLTLGYLQTVSSSIRVYCLPRRSELYAVQNLDLHPEELRTSAAIEYFVPHPPEAAEGLHWPAPLSKSMLRPDYAYIMHGPTFPDNLIQMSMSTSIRSSTYDVGLRASRQACHPTGTWCIHQHEEKPNGKYECERDMRKTCISISRHNQLSPIFALPRSSSLKALPPPQTPAYRGAGRIRSTNTTQPPPEPQRERGNHTTGADDAFQRMWTPSKSQPARVNKLPPGPASELLALGRSGSQATSFPGLERTLFRTRQQSLRIFHIWF